MLPRSLALVCAALWVLSSTLTAQPSTFTVDEIRPGMIGVGRTVFERGTIEEFKVHVLGVLRNVIGPRRNLVLARLEGGPLGHTGVIAGMSGSPVYIDGRLLGAVSYSLGQFSKEPIAGITPIAEMTEATALPVAISGARPVAMSWPPVARELFSIWTRELGGIRPFVDAPDAAQLIGVHSGLPEQIGHLLRPISVPLVSAGFSSDGLAPLAPTFTNRGWLPTAAPETAPVPEAEHPLRPGDAVGVSLVSGDFTLGSTGTVTHVDGDRVYAFGHPMYNLGPTEFPMTRADVHVILPSLLQSSKIASLGQVIGTIQQDRATAVAGRLGAGPSMIPVRITLNSDRSSSRSFTFDVVRDQTFTPLLTYLTVANVLTSYERAAGPASFTVRGSATIRGHAKLAFEDIFTGDQPAGGAAAYVAGPLTVLLRNANEAIRVDGVTLDIDATEQARTARIERVWLDTARPRAGRQVTLHALLRTFDGTEIVKQLPIDIPGNATGTLQLLVADAARLAQEDRRETRQAESQRASQLIRTFNRSRRSNRLYVRLSSPAPGAIVNGEAMASLPPSVLAVLESDRSSGTVGSLREATRGEWELPVELAVSGSRVLNIQLERP